MSSELVEIARFPTSFEASIARNALESEDICACLDGEAMASWFWYLGSAVGGVRLLVNSNDAERAHMILSNTSNRQSENDSPVELSSTDKDFTSLDERNTAELPLELIHAWRASIIGLLLLPPLLNLYSFWLICRHRLLSASRNHPVNWRAPAAFCVNLVMFALVVLFICWVTTPSQPLPTIFTTDSKPLEETTRIVIPLVPSDAITVEEDAANKE